MHRSQRMRLLIAILLAAVVGCGERTAAFRPTENVKARGQGGQPAAAYEIRAAPGQDPQVHVNVWSRGAYVDDDRTFIDLAVSVRNTSDAPVQLARDTLVLEAFDKHGAPLAPGQLVRVDGPQVQGGPPPAGPMIAPASAGGFRLQFALQAGVEPGDVGSLRLRWGILHDGGQRYVQFTEFQRVREPNTATAWAYYDPVFGFYDPFWYPYGYRAPVGRVIVVDRGDDGRFRDHRNGRAD